MRKHYFIILITLFTQLFIYSILALSCLMVPFISNYFSLTAAKASEVILVFLLGCGGTYIFFHQLASKFGAQKLLFVGFSIALLSSLGCLISSTFTIIIIAQLALGVSCGALLASTHILPLQLSSDHIPDNNPLGRLISLSIGLLISAGIGGCYIYYWGWLSVFYLSLFFSVTGIVLSIILHLKYSFERSKIHINFLSSAVIFLSLGSLFFIFESKHYFEKFIFFAVSVISFFLFSRTISSAIERLPDYQQKNRQIIRLNFLSSLYNLIKFGNLFLLPFFFIKGIGLDIFDLAYLFIIPVLAFIFTTIIIKYYSKYIASRFVGVLGAVLMIIVSVLFLYFQDVNYPLTIVGLTLYGIAFSMVEIDLILSFSYLKDNNIALNDYKVKDIIPFFSGVVGIGSYSSLYTFYYWKDAGLIVEKVASIMSFSTIMTISLSISIFCLILEIWPFRSKIG